MISFMRLDETTNERTSGNGAFALWFHTRYLNRAVPDRER
jgi:hypothetical protein